MKNGGRIFVIWMNLFLHSLVAMSQTSFTQLQLPEIRKNNSVVKQSWCGGFQAPQFSDIDLNFDGRKDLFVFDRYDQSISTFINNGFNYTLEMDYSKAFPSLDDWVLLRDFNCDGKNDIFTGGQDGVTIYKNVSSNNSLQFTLVDKLIQTTNNTLLYVPAPNMPSIDDIDQDGDMDILTFNAPGEYVTFYKNMSNENGDSCSLQFMISTVCWGDFKEDGFFVLGDSCGGNVSSGGTNANKMHTSSSLLTIDLDGDNDRDLLTGENGTNNIAFLRNGNNSYEATMDTVINNFPVSSPVNLPHFATPYYLDVDFDGVKDLIVAPNTPSSIRNFDNIIEYKNIASDSIVDLVLNQTPSLSKNIIDFGEGAAPAFLDYDLDGDQDLIVGNITYRETVSYGYNGLALLENINGTYHFIDSNYAEIKGKNIFSAQPTFGDIDGDGDQDMLVGDYFGVLHFFENVANQGSAADFFLDSSVFGGIDVGNNASPFLTDMDGDTDLDLWIGEKDGNLNYYENQGTPTNPYFVLITDSAGFISTTSTLNSTEGYSTPRIIDIDEDGNKDLVSGSFDGSIRLYKNIMDSINLKVIGTHLSYSNTLFNNSDTLMFGYRSSPALANLTNDTLIDMVVGIYRGGLMTFKGVSKFNAPSNSDKVLNNTIKIYPNPAKRSLFLDNNMVNNKLVIFNTLGEQVHSEKLLVGINEVNLNLRPGIYIIKTNTNNQFKNVQKLIIE